MHFLKHTSCMLLLGGIFLGTACNRPGGQGSHPDGDSLNRLADRYYMEGLAFSPLEATFNGENQFNDQLPIDIGQPFRLKRDSFLTSFANALTAFDTASLNNNDRITYEMLQRDIAVNKEALTFRTYLMPINQMISLPLTIAQFGSGKSAQPFKTEKDYQNFISRMKQFAIWADTAIANMKQGIAEGYVLPKSLVVKIIPQMTGLAKDEPGNVFYSPLEQLPADLDSAGKQSLAATYKAAVQQYLIASYAKLGTYLQNEYLPKARSTSGFSDLPDGKDFYNYAIRYWTTTTLSPDEIFAIGEKEVARIRAEMETIKNSTGYKGDLASFFQFVRNDRQFKIFKTPQAVLDSFHVIQERIAPAVKRLYHNAPKTKFEIRQTEAFRAASAAAEYQQGTPDGTRPGIFYVPIINPADYNYTGMESLFLHEAIPGHHFQFSLQQENDSLNKFRRFTWIGAYGEGYALYSESLGKELGIYTNPYMYFGHLGEEIHRAIRLVVDVGLHTKNWTREQAIKYMMDNEPVSEQEATAEIERYMAMPAQALSYKIGELRIQALRARYTKQLGDKFSLADFHEELLKDGCVPLSVLENKMARRFGK